MSIDALQFSIIKYDNHGQQGEKTFNEHNPIQKQQNSKHDHRKGKQDVLKK
jgi:hypothetical protein